MKKLKGKFHSQSGASAVLALLFLLVCMMVAASVLMAAVSNAGKIQSNYEEQQRYLVLSSALRLIAGELEHKEDGQGAEYRGRYTVLKWTEELVKRGEDDELDESTKETNYYYQIEQNLGAFSCGPLSELDEEGKTPVNPVDGSPLNKEVLTFRKELDGLFAKEFTGTGDKPLDKGEIAALPTNPSGVPPEEDEEEEGRTTRFLTVSVTGAEGRFEDVTVEIDMDQSCRIHLKATMASGENAGGKPYTMEAELAPDGAPVIDYPLEMWQPKKDRPLEGPSETPEGVLTVKYEDSEEKESGAVTWRLDWITREVKEADG